MKKSILYVITVLFAFLSCQEKATNRSKHDSSSVAIENKQKDTESIREIFETMTDGFKNNDLTGFYDSLHENAIIIDGAGNEIYDKENIVNHFETRLATKDIKLTSWKLHEIIVSDSLALSRAEYQITYLENGEVIGNTDSNWHIVWKKSKTGAWQIVREIFNEREG